MKHQARKRFGQNFLQDQAVIERIIAAMRLKPDDNVVEVGPGLGALTLPLTSQLNQLSVIEIDRDLIGRLKNLNLSHVDIIDQDVLKVDLRQFTGDHKLRLIGNLPYNIGTPLLLRLCRCHDVLKDVHVMLQKEVVDRLHAPIASRAYGRLSVIMQSVFIVEPLFTVPSSAFEPAPKVESAVVRLLPKPDAPNEVVLDQLEHTTRIAFAAKRKTLRNNFKKLLGEEELLQIGINPQARAETLEIDAFHRLSKRLSKI